MSLIFKKSHPGRQAKTQRWSVAPVNDIPAQLLRKDPPLIPEVTELQVVRHYTCLSQKNFSIDTHFYPLGSCTMKYNPRAAHKLASLPAFIQAHPLTPDQCQQGFLQCMHELQNILQALTGMAGVSLTPMAGAQGEFAGVAMIKAYHAKNNQAYRTEMLVPETAHGTNPASAVMCGYTVVEVKTNASGDVDLEDLDSKITDKLAGIMLTNPSTGGVFERGIEAIAKKIHGAGGLLYYDGANLNAIMGKAKPGDMGFDVLHMNLHKTFATPHGGGGPGSGPVACAKRLVEFLPTPIVEKTAQGYAFADDSKRPESIGPLSAFMGNAGILLRAYIYARLLGREGLAEASEMATLNANYLQKLIADLGIELAYPGRRATHECLVTFKKQAKADQVSAKDIAKRLLDYGVHAPTTYFPLTVPECFLIEPTETENKETLDNFANTLKQILDEIRDTPDLVRTAPHTLPVSRLDDVKAARNLDLCYAEGYSPS
jgi:glycine dehydrogenase subunit 2